jgi:PII-like signaling protein
MRLHGSAARLTIFVDEADQWHHRPIYVEIIHRAHRAGLAGATALRGVEGFAAASEIHTTHLFTLGEHLPIVIIIVDDMPRLRAFLDSLDGVLGKGVAMIDDVETIHYRAEPRRRGRPAAAAADPAADLLD